MADVEVEGESYRREAIGRLMNQFNLPKGGVRYRHAMLVPEPTNDYDRNAVKVIIDGHHVGYEPAGFAVRTSAMYQSIIRSGQQPLVLARIWARPDGEVWRGRVTLIFNGQRDECEVDYAEQTRREQQRRAEQSLRAADWQREQVAGAVSGVYFSAHKPEVDRRKRDGDYAGAARLLVECIAAAHRVAALADPPSTPVWWPSEQLAIVLRKQHRFADEVAAIEDYIASCGAADVPFEAQKRLASAREKVVRHRAEARLPNATPGDEDHQIGGNDPA